MVKCVSIVFAYCFTMATISRIALIDDLPNCQFDLCKAEWFEQEQGWGFYLRLATRGKVNTSRRTKEKVGTPTRLTRVGCIQIGTSVTFH